METKECNDCHETKTIDQFIKNKNKCKPCFSIYQKKARKKNKSGTKYYYSHKEKMSEYSKSYSKENRDKRNELQRNWRKKQREENPSYKLWENARKRIWKIMHSLKKNKTNELIGTTPIMYKLWLQYTFSDGMTWENYGTFWHIDHVKPIAEFNLKDEEQVFEAFNWTNCRAETAKFNIEKQDNIIKEQVEKHKFDLKYFKLIQDFKNSLKLKIRSRVTCENE